MSAILAKVGAKLADKSADEVTANEGLWVGKAVDVANRLASNSSSTIAAQALRSGAVVLRDNADTFGELTVGELHDVALNLAIGNEDAAYCAWLEATATVEQRLAAEDAADLAVRTDTAQRAQRWADFKAAILKFLAAAGQAALPILVQLLLAV